MKTIAKSVILLIILLAAQAYAVPDPGRIYSSPRVLDDTLNSNAILSTGIWLHNPSDSFSVSVTDIITFNEWMYVSLGEGYTVWPNDSVFVPVEINSISYGGQNLIGHITFENNGIAPQFTVDVKIHVTTDPPIGGLISAMPTDFNLELEPYLSGDLYLDVTNTGDLYLNISNVQTSSAVLTPVYFTYSLAPKDRWTIRLNVNTFVGENVFIQDTIKIFSDAANFPIMSVPVFIHIKADSVGGVYPLGDVNLDGWCNIVDAYMIQYYLLGLVTTLPCMAAADVNNNGTVTGTDVVYLRRYLQKIGPPPLNQCFTPPVNFPGHLSGREISINYLKGHRSEWINTPVMIQTPSYYSMQVSMGFMGDIIDSVNATNTSGHPTLTPRAILLDSLSGHKSIVLYEDDVQTARSPIPLYTPMPLYNLQLHIPVNAPSGTHPLFSTNASDRGPSVIDSYSGNLEAPMFTGTNLTIAPRVALGKLSGVGELIYVPDSTIIHPSITVYCDGPEIADVYIVIRDSSGTIDYTDTLQAVAIMMGENQITFTDTWIARGGRGYIAGAGVIVDGDDYPADNFGGIRINMTAQKTIGLPPTEDFEPGLILDFPPVGYSIVKRPDPPGGTPSWKESSDKAKSGTYSVAIIGQTDDVSDEWFIKGPIDWTSVNEPAIQFYEAQSDWTDYGYKHELYIYVGEEFNVEDAVDGGALLTHTPGSHTIVSDFILATMQEIDLSAYGNTNNVWFAFRYLKNPENYLGDNWYIDDISWVDNAPGPSGYEYLPGDANMGVATWPSSLEGGDVTRMVRFFKGLLPECVFHNPAAHHAPTPDTLADTVFYASADANGNCEVRGSDVTRLVAYFKGNAATPASCEDYPPISLIEANFPACDTPPLKR